MDPQAAPQAIPPAEPVLAPAEAPVAEGAAREVILQPVPVPRKRSTDRTKAREEILINMMWLFGAIVVVGLVLAIVKAWFRRSTLDDNEAGRLGSFREMLESGELTQDEYDRIMQKMAAKIKGKSGPTVTTTAPSTTPVTPPQVNQPPLKPLSASAAEPAQPTSPVVTSSDPRSPTSDDSSPR